MRSSEPRLATLGVVALIVLSGCGSGGDGAPPATATGTLEELASAVDCAPDVQIDADEIRQALCGNGDDEFVLVTFATERGQREWLDGAQDYGGHYLVGAGWIAVGGSDTITALHGRLGGAVEEGLAHHPGSGADGGGQPHPGHGG